MVPPCLVVPGLLRHAGDNLGTSRGQFGDVAVTVTSRPFRSVPMALLALLGCVGAVLLAATATALLVAAHRLGLLYRILYKVRAKRG